MPSGFDSWQSTDKYVDVTEVLQSDLPALFHKFYGHYNDPVCQYNLPLDQMLSGVFHANRSAVLVRLILSVAPAVSLN
jgi:hypothetical protein